MRTFILKEENRRYKLLYEWDMNLPKVLFIMFNPTIRTNPDEPGRTSQRVIKYAKDKGFGGVWIGNLFSYISSNPNSLIDCLEAVIGDKNDAALRQMAGDSAEIIFAWGSFSFAIQRAEEIKKMFPQGKAISLNKDGSPCHPLSYNFKY
jgi:hypothetical protein